MKTPYLFQGRKKEVIIVPFVRSNLEGNLVFLENLRRLDVSITRAKMKLVLYLLKIYKISLIIS